MGKMKNARESNELTGNGTETEKAENLENPQSRENLENRENLESRENLENVLMRFCRQGKRYTTKTVATHLGVSIDVYRKMEKGDLLITYKQAVQLGDLYEVGASWFFKEAIQLDLLLSRMAIIRILKNKNDLLIDRLKSSEKSNKKQ